MCLNPLSGALKTKLFSIPRAKDTKRCQVDTLQGFVTYMVLLGFQPFARSLLSAFASSIMMALPEFGSAAPPIT